MAFIRNGNQVISFATSDDLEQVDQRLFEANESLDSTVVQEHLIRATDRILSQLQGTQWWRNYFVQRNTGNGAVTVTTVADIPAPEAVNILGRKDDFTDLCCYMALYNFTLPSIADFSNDDSAERKKMAYYQQKYDLLFSQLITQGDWYDFDSSLGLNSQDFEPGVSNLRRVR